ncbi:MAG: flavocytochrome c [Clostridiaceae bacterium]
MRKLVKVLLIGFLIMGMVGTAFGCAAKTKDTTFKAGTYEGVADGHGGKITATVTVTENEITEIKIDAPDETEGLGDVAGEKIVKMIMEGQNLNVDTVSGATNSSKGMIAAITAALEKAGADIKALQNAEAKASVEVKQEDLTADIVVIGAGGAGMAAAVEASEAGKSVIIVEKMPIVGGNTNRATGGINAAETKVQEAAGIVDTKETFYQDTLVGGKEKNDPILLRTMVDNAPGAVDWLNEMGAGLTRVTLSGGATNPRIHTPEDGSPVGPVVVRVLSDKLKELKVNIMMETTAKKIIAKDGAVTGIEAADVNGNSFLINAKAVIVTTGGFGANSTMVEEYRPDLVGFSTTNHSGATGDGIKMALEAGAGLTDIGEIQTHPTTDPESGYMFTEGLRGDGAILINSSGVRFTDELLTRDVVSANILKQEGGIAYLITNEEMKLDNASLAGYVKKGYAIEGKTIEELAKALEIDATALTNTMSTYSEAVKSGVDQAFNREHLTQTLENGPYYALKVTPGIHHTMGGLKIDNSTHVLTEEGTIISGLYAAGEVTGGVHGGNRIGGNAVTDIIVFGRIAGQMASGEMK